MIEEQHYSPKELAKRWGLSSRFVRDLFKNEPGVLTIERPEERYKRAYTTIRIPASIAARVYERHLSKQRRTTPSRRAPSPVCLQAAFPDAAPKEDSDAA